METTVQAEKPAKRTRALAVPAAGAVLAQPQTQSNALMAMIEKAVSDQTFDVAKLESLLAVKERWEKEEARKAFVVALAEFKENPPVVLKKKKVQFTTDRGTTSYKHATLGDACEIIGAHLAKFGLSHRWSPKQADGKMAVTCILTHVLGHSESVTLEGPYDQSGGKNAIQAIVSAKTYLERHTLFAVTGLASKDEDDDGAAASKPPKAENVPGPKDSPALAQGEDTFQPPIPCITQDKKTSDLYFKGGARMYRIKKTDAETAKLNFKAGDTAIVNWEKRGEIYWVVEIARTPAGSFI